MSIVTLTMNPAIDIASNAKEVRPVDKMRCAPPRFDPGGGGINVARTVAALGEAVTAVFPVGGPPGAVLERLVHETGVPMRTVPIAEWTRENIAVTDRTSGEQYRFVFPGPRLVAPEYRHCLSEVDRLARNARYVVASGSLPPGVPAEFYQTLADMLRSLDVPLVLDTAGAALRAIRSGVYLVKPSVRELSELVQRPLPDRAAQSVAARELIDVGLAEIVLLSLGADGALVVTASDTQWFAPMEVTVRSGIGAGDAMVGGVCAGLVRGDALPDAVRLGVAAATAALCTPGTRPGQPARIAELLDAAKASESSIPAP